MYVLTYKQKIYKKNIQVSQTTIYIKNEQEVELISIN